MIGMIDFEEPAWANDIPAGEFISHSTSYKVGKYFDLFDSILFQMQKLEI